MHYSYAAVAFQDKAFAMKWVGADQSYGYANIMTPYQENEWVHLVYTVEAVDNMSIIKAYVNGQPIAVEQGGNWDNSLMSQMGIDNFTIGGKNPYKGGDVPMCLFYGAIDEVQIYSGVLNADEAAYLYNYQLNAPDPEPVPDPEPTEPPATEPDPTEPKPTGTEPVGTEPGNNTSDNQGGNNWIVPVIIAVVAVAAVAVVVVIIKKKK